MLSALKSTDRRSTEEYISTLEDQVDSLTSKLASLTIQLNTVTEEASYLRETSKSPREFNEMQEKLTKRIRELEVESAGLSEKFSKQTAESNNKVTALKHDNELLQHQLAAFKDQLTRMDTLQRYNPFRSDGLTDKGDDNTERFQEPIDFNVSEEMTAHVEAYVATVAEANHAISAIISELRSDFGSVVENLSDSVNNVFESLGAIDAFNQRIELSMIPTEEIAMELKQHVAELADAVKQSTAKVQQSIFDKHSANQMRESYEKGFSKFSAPKDGLKISGQFTKQTNGSKQTEADVNTAPSSPSAVPPLTAQIGDEIKTAKESESVDAAGLKVNTRIKLIDVFGKKH